MPLTANVVPNTPIEASWGNDIRDRTVQRFTSAAERASAWTTPPTGSLSVLDSLPGVVWIYAAGAWKLTAPRGQLSVASVTAGMTPTTSVADVPGVTVTFSGVANHVYRYTLAAHVVSSAAGDIVRIQLTNPSNTAVGTVADFPVAIANNAQALTQAFYETPGADASLTRKIRVVRIGGSGSVQVFSDVNRPAVLTVEEIHVGTSGG